jgi:hypothetical protein
MVTSYCFFVAALGKEERIFVDNALLPFFVMNTSYGGSC